MSVWSVDVRFTAPDEQSAKKITESFFLALSQVFGNAIVTGPYEVTPVEDVLARLEENE